MPYDGNIPSTTSVKPIEFRDTEPKCALGKRRIGHLDSLRGIPVQVCGENDRVDQKHLVTLGFRSQESFPE